MEPDPTVLRVERTAWVASGVMALMALVAGRGDLRLPGAVLGGTALIAGAYWSLKAGVSVLIPSTQGVARPQPRRAKAMFKVAGRYALLGFLAYVMIARLRLPPLGLLAGASSFVAAVSIEALRLLIRKH